MPGPVTIGLFPSPQAPPYAALAERVRRAEAMGFDAIWLAEQTAMPYPGVISFEAWSLLGALARETTRVRLGTLVSPVAFRHPALLAQSLVTVDHVSGGRVTLGLGAGGVAEDLAALGEPGLTAADLVDRLAEQLAILDPLLRGERVSRVGGHYPTEAAVDRPVQQPRPPILVAAQGPRTLALAARHADIWNSLGGQPQAGERRSLDEALAVTRRQVDAIDAACAAIGRDPATLRRSVMAFRAGLYSTPGKLADWMGRYGDLGFEEFILIWPPAGDGQAAAESILERFVATELPALQPG